MSCRTYCAIVASLVGRTISFADYSANEIRLYLSRASVKLLMPALGGTLIPLLFPRPTSPSYLLRANFNVNACPIVPLKISFRLSPGFSLFLSPHQAALRSSQTSDKSLDVSLPLSPRSDFISLLLLFTHDSRIRSPFTGISVLC